LHSGSKEAAELDEILSFFEVRKRQRERGSEREGGRERGAERGG